MIKFDLLRKKYNKIEYKILKIDLELYRKVISQSKEFNGISGPPCPQKIKNLKIFRLKR